MTKSDSPENKLHLFFDAEGTLYLTRNNYEFKDFWNGEHTLERAKKIFRLDSDIKECLEKVKEEDIPMYVVSRHKKELLPDMLEYFGIKEYFNEIIIILNGNKGKKISEVAEENNIGLNNCLMFGDMYDLDIEPVRNWGIHAVIIDREHNKNDKGPRVADFKEALENIIEMNIKLKDDIKIRKRGGVEKW